MGSRRLFFGEKGEIVMEAVFGIAVIVGFFVFGLSLVGLVFYGAVNGWKKQVGISFVLMLLLFLLNMGFAWCLM